MTSTLHSASPEETFRLGQAIGRRLGRGDVVLLHGELGSGKTVLAQGIAAGLRVKGAVPSPTFTLVNEYQGHTGTGEPVDVYHLDLYRLYDDSDLDSFGFDDFIAPVDGISVIEWPERAATRLNGVYLLIRLATVGNQRRRLELSPCPASTERYSWINELG